MNVLRIIPMLLIPVCAILFYYLRLDSDASSIATISQDSDDFNYLNVIYICIVIIISFLVWKRFSKPKKPIASEVVSTPQNQISPPSESPKSNSKDELDSPSTSPLITSDIIDDSQQPPPTPISVPISNPTGVTTFPGSSNILNFLLHVGYDRLNTDHYTQRSKEELDLITRNANYFGLQIRYHSCISVEIVEAKELKEKNIIKKGTDAYCLLNFDMPNNISYSNKSSFRTATKLNTTCPVWNQTFYFDVSTITENLDLHLRIFQSSGLGDKFVGEAFVNTDSLKEDLWVTLEKRNNVKDNRGKVLLRINKSISVVDNFAFTGKFLGKSIIVGDLNKGAPLQINGKWGKNFTVKYATGKELLVVKKIKNGLFSDPYYTIGGPNNITHFMTVTMKSASPRNWTYLLANGDTLKLMGEYPKFQLLSMSNQFIASAEIKGQYNPWEGILIFVNPSTNVLLFWCVLMLVLDKYKARFVE